MSTWKEIWEKKGMVDTTDLRLLDGFEGTAFDHAQIAPSILRDLGHRSGDSILEVGCGAGCLAQHLPSPYHGIERSVSLASKHRTLMQNKVTVGEADALPVQNGAYDYVVIFSVVHYFADQNYLRRTLSEAIRVARKGAIVCDIRTKPRKTLPGKDVIPTDGTLTHLLVPSDTIHSLLPENTPFQIRSAYCEHYGAPYNLLIGTKRPMTIYTDMCADLFHAGHVNFLRQCKNLFPHTRLVVGIHNDATIETYKRTPICNNEERVAVVRACRYVDEVFEKAPFVPTPSMWKAIDVDVVVHADGLDDETKRKMYGEAIERGMYREVPRTDRISTTQIIARIRRKGEQEQQQVPHVFTSIIK